MSKSTKQSLVLMAVINSGLKAVQQCFSYGAKLDSKLQYAMDYTEHALICWNVTI